jgi:phage I-like protein
MRNYRVLDSVVDVIVDDDAPLPVEFRLLRAGVNPTRKGDVVFDAAAAERVMAEAAAWGVDQLIDLEHDSLDTYTRAVRNNAADAMGWFRLALREGELWAVNVTWTAEGERRLRAKTQRYISPAFEESEDGSPTWIINVALCSMPATHGAQPLVAASLVALAANGANSMDPKLITEALDALIAGDAEKCMTILKGVIASAAGAEAPEEAPAEPDASAESPDPAPDPNLVAAMALRRLTGREDTTEAIAELRRMRDTVASLSAERDAEVLAERRTLVGELVRLGVEYPSTAWAGEAELRNPVRRLAGEPIAELRARVAAYTALRPTADTARVSPPVSGSDSDHERRLTAGMTDQQRADYVALRATRRAQ